MKLSAINIKKESFLQGDMVVWMILLALCMISIVEVYSASSRMTYNSLNYWDPVIEHTTYILAGLFVAWLVHKAHCKSFKGLSVLGMVVSIALLFAVLFLAVSDLVSVTSCCCCRWADRAFIRQMKRQKAVSGERTPCEKRLFLCLPGYC